jgi:hypothetical protein
MKYNRVIFSILSGIFACAVFTLALFNTHSPGLSYAGDAKPDEPPFEIATFVGHGNSLLDIGSVGRLPLPDPDPGSPAYKLKPIPISKMSFGGTHGVKDNRDLEHSYRRFKYDKSYELDKIFAEYPTEKEVKYAYFTRFRIRPDGSVDDVDFIYQDHYYREKTGSGDEEPYEYYRGLPKGVRTDRLEKALLAEMAGWQFPESEREVTHYSWLRYANYETSLWR